MEREEVFGDVVIYQPQQLVCQEGQGSRRFAPRRPGLETALDRCLSLRLSFLQDIEDFGSRALCTRRPQKAASDLLLRMQAIDDPSP